MSVFKPRATWRNRPICWHNSTMQFVNTITWPSCFYEHERKEQDIVADTFNFIKQLQTNHCNPVPAQICNSKANNFIQYVNYQQSQHRKSDEVVTSPSWHIWKQQDAQACVGYFFNMIVDPEKPDNIPDALSVTTDNINRIDQMQNFVKKHFIFATHDWINCENKNIGRYLRPIRQYILNLSLPQDNSDIALQKLIDDNLQEEEIELADCIHCDHKHAVTKQTQIAQLSEKYLMIQINRFARDVITNLSSKKNNTVFCDEPVLIKCNGNYVAYKVISTINHLYGQIHNGHYSTSIKKSNTFVEIDDHKITPLTSFNGETAYVLLLEKMSFQDTSTIMFKYLQNKHEEKQQQNKTTPTTKTTTKTLQRQTDIATNSTVKTVESKNVKKTKPKATVPKKNKNTKSPTKKIQKQTPKKRKYGETDLNNSILKNNRSKKQKQEVAKNSNNAKTKTIATKPSMRKKAPTPKPTQTTNKTFEMMDKINLKKSVSEYPSGITKTFLKKLHQLQKKRRGKLK